MSKKRLKKTVVFRMELDTDEYPAAVDDRLTEDLQNDIITALEEYLPCKITEIKFV